MASTKPWFSDVKAGTGLRLAAVESSDISYDHVLKELDDAYRDLRDLQREVNGFMNDYWQKVGTWFERLVRLEHGHEELPADEAQLNKVWSAPAVHGYAEQARALKQSYRRVLKRIHPDTAHTPHPMPVTWLKLAQAAFERGSLYSLWQLERQLDESETKQLPSTMDEAAQLEQMLERLQALHAQAQHLRVSDEYVLLQRARLADVNGEDWIADVIEKVQLKIAKLRRRQALARMSQLVQRYKNLLAEQKIGHEQPLEFSAALS